ncbi:50S ribosomal protein L25/general stress protein Ctc [Propionibacteriaceae bacterium Y2011]
MSEVKLAALPRTEFGKGAARRTRRAHRIPAVLYANGVDPIHVTLPGHETMLALRVDNALLTIDIEGSEQRLALPRQVQRDPLKGTIEHVDLIIVKRGQKVDVDVAIHIVGEAAPDSMVSVEHNDIRVEAEATNIPTGFEVSVEGLEPGAQIFAKDITLPEGTVLAIDEETLIVNVTNAPTQAELDAELAEAEAEAGIEHDEPEDASGEGESADAAGDGDSDE